MNSMRVLLSHPTGNENSRQAARALAESGALAIFATSSHLCSGTIPWRWLPGRLQKEAARRDISTVGGRIQFVAAARECARLAAARIRRANMPLSACSQPNPSIPTERGFTRAE